MGNSSYFSSGDLADKATSLCIGIAIGFQPQALDVCVSRSAVIAFVALDFADLDHLGGAIRASVSISKRQNINALVFESDIVEFVSLSHVRVRWVGLQSAKMMILKFCDWITALQLSSYQARRRGC